MHFFHYLKILLSQLIWLKISDRFNGKIRRKIQIDNSSQQKFELKFLMTLKDGDVVQIKADTGSAI